GDEDRVMTHGHDGTHVEHGPDLRAPGPDRAPAAQGSAVAVEGGDADERGNLPTTQRAELGQGRHERGGQDGADAGGTAQQVVLLAPQRTGANALPEVLIELGDLLVQPRNVGLELRPNAPGGPRQPVLFRREHLDQLPPALEQRGEFLGLGVGQGAGRRPEDLGELCEQLGIEPVGLGQEARGAGEIAHLPRVHDRHRQRGGREGPRHGDFPAARRFQDDQCGCEPAQSRDECTQTGFLMSDRPALATGAHRDIQLLLRHIDTDEEGRGGTHRISSLPGLARCGLRVAQATVRAVEEVADATTHAALRSRTTLGESVCRARPALPSYHFPLLSRYKGEGALLEVERYRRRWGRRQTGSSRASTLASYADWPPGMRGSRPSLASGVRQASPRVRPLRPGQPSGAQTTPGSTSSVPRATPPKRPRALLS